MVFNHLDHSHLIQQTKRAKVNVSAGIGRVAPGGVSTPFTCEICIFANPYLACCNSLIKKQASLVNVATNLWLKTGRVSPASWRVLQPFQPNLNLKICCNSWDLNLRSFGQHSGGTLQGWRSNRFSWSLEAFLANPIVMVCCNRFLLQSFTDVTS